MMYNTCAVCGNAFLAEGTGPAYRLCPDDKDYTLRKYESRNKGYSAAERNMAETLYLNGISPRLISREMDVPYDEIGKWIRDGGWAAKMEAVKAVEGAA